eukprot:3093829-Rhodomonas_salina.4
MQYAEKRLVSANAALSLGAENRVVWLAYPPTISMHDRVCIGRRWGVQQEGERVGRCREIGCAAVEGIGCA